MTRHQRRKLARKRADERGEILNRRALLRLQQETAKRSLADPHRPERSPMGLGNRGIYQGVGMYPTRGYGTGSFKPDPTAMTDRELSAFRWRCQKKGLDK